ncbi:4a-hydroxytetrahydrobiopterin dehydratase [Roseimaritima sediminicola]|uniref:4a-hydroxytetrahydrobiopterin dehydratase n=1 Tax=Roseimaritima sediminicola TaxID=2662066 RepID=UPI0012984B06|nr:4a-hydroxytetrahydrobiopterin dehydratase [Roseimaritima sediminicola]
MDPKTLTSKRCKPCEGGVDPMQEADVQQHLAAVPAWSLSGDGRAIGRKCKRKNFVQAMDVLNRAAEIAEAEQHHPDLHLTGYRHVEIVLTTHAIGGLSENDFIVAAKLDAVLDDAT